MRSGTGFLSLRQRRWAWVAFIVAAMQAPLSAHLLTDASWMFCLCVAGMVATVIIADDARRHRPSTDRQGSG